MNKKTIILLIMSMGISILCILLCYYSDNNQLIDESISSQTSQDFDSISIADTKKSDINNELFDSQTDESEMNSKSNESKDNKSKSKEKDMSKNTINSINDNANDKDDIVIDDNGNDSSNIKVSEYVNINKMQFTLNNKKYKLGETTLRQMINDNISFDSNDMTHANEYLDANSESQGFHVVLNSDISIQICTINTTDSRRKIADCVLGELYVTINTSNIDSKVFSFEFPLDITEKQLKKEAGKPTNCMISNDLHSYEYQQESSLYYKNYGYVFDFVNGSLCYVTMTYLP